MSSTTVAFLTVVICDEEMEQKNGQRHHFVSDISLGLRFHESEGAIYLRNERAAGDDGEDCGVGVQAVARYRKKPTVNINNTIKNIVDILCEDIYIIIDTNNIY